MSRLKKPAVVDDLIASGLPKLPSMSRAQQNEIFNWARCIVEHFDLVLEKQPVKPRNIASLPCTERELKLAIKILLMIHIAKDESADVEALKRLYIKIASLLDIGRADMEALTTAMGDAKEYSAIPTGKVYPSYQHYLDLALAKQTTLLDEINNFIASIKDL